MKRYPLYPIISSASLLIRVYLCYITVEKYPIFANDSTNWLFGQIISIYTIFRLICFPIVGVISEKMDIESPSVRSFIYFLLYIPLLLIYWVVLMLLTNVLHWLPA